MRLLKTHSHTSERRGYEADKERQVKRERKGPIRNGVKTLMKTTAMSTGGGRAGRKRVDGKAKTQSSVTTAASGGEAKLYLLSLIHI